MPNTQLADYIKIYPDVLTAEHCQALIDRFEASSQRAARQNQKSFSFVQLDVTQHWPDEHKRLIPLLLAKYEEYKEELKLGPFWPARFFFEHLRLKRYLPNGRDSFPLHVDVYDNASACRFLTSILYLNATEGGETAFPDLDVNVAPVPGKLVVFPPLWVFPHAGLPPVSASKYILHSYLLYPPPNGGPAA
jgi:prolyl 4-hydroxylase